VLANNGRTDGQPFSPANNASAACYGRRYKTIIPDIAAPGSCNLMTAVPLMLDVCGSKFTIFWGEYYRGPFAVQDSSGARKIVLWGQALALGQPCPLHSSSLSSPSFPFPFPFPDPFLPFPPFPSLPFSSLFLPLRSRPLKSS